MNTRGFFDFYYALYTGDNGNEVINALRFALLFGIILTGEH